VRNKSTGLIEEGDLDVAGFGDKEQVYVESP
jgi:hypothetical protein